MLSQLVWKTGNPIGLLGLKMSCDKVSDLFHSLIGCGGYHVIVRFCYAVYLQLLKTQPRLPTLYTRPSFARSKGGSGNETNSLSESATSPYHQILERAATELLRESSK